MILLSPILVTLATNLTFVRMLNLFPRLFICTTSNTSVYYCIYLLRLSQCVKEMWENIGTISTTGNAINMQAILSSIGRSRCKTFDIIFRKDKFKEYIRVLLRRSHNTLCMMKSRRRSKGRSSFLLVPESSTHNAN
jgi:hypothetical protein